ncbi:glycosyltransferase [Carboxylicivirga sp. N1Y90]|uniref:glycosyltransferase n=1 Tax=Carboxylicivirga fragile TaxID=3417571 RepID=UPI003D34AA24|nr:glycosyltransferase [Marinilabiliaceae bacterium N1Y90]
MQKKKILIFIDWFLPGYKAGGPVRSMANMVEYLKDEYDFYIITRNTDYTETTAYTSVKSNCWEEYISGVQVFYADFDHQNKATFKSLIEEVKANVIYVNGVYSWKFSILPLVVARKAKVNKTIVASRGMLAQSAIDVKGRKKRLFLKLAKLAGLYKNVVFHATNEKEEQDIKKGLGPDSYRGGLKVLVADNLPKRELPEIKTLEKRSGELKLVSLARIAPEKNTLFALERLLELGAFDNTSTLPRQCLDSASTLLGNQTRQPNSATKLGDELRNYDWNITFDLYGQIYDEDYWRECEGVIKQLPANIEVNYKGTVDAELVGETIQNYHALYMPTRGENFGHVILESLSAGRPVLISDQTPWRGLENIRAGWDISLESEVRSSKSAVYDLENTRYENACRAQSRQGGKGNDDTRKKTWCSVLSALVQMEQEEFDVWCEGARNRAEEFVSDEKLQEQYYHLFDT